eukprot:g5954.t1
MEHKHGATAINIKNNQLKALIIRDPNFKEEIPVVFFDQTVSELVQVTLVQAFRWYNHGYFCKFPHLRMVNIGRPKNNMVSVCLMRQLTSYVIFCHSIRSRSSIVYNTKQFENSRMVSFSILACPHDGAQNVKARFPLFPATSNLKHFSLFDSGLNATLPIQSDFNENGTLSHLERLVVTGEYLHGPLRIWSTCTKLTYLNFGSNNLTGNVGVVIENLINLEKLYLFHNNHIYGLLPNITLKSLRCIDLRGTNVSGPIPRQYFHKPVQLLLLPGHLGNDLLRKNMLMVYDSHMTCEMKRGLIYRTPMRKAHKFGSVALYESDTYIQCKRPDFDSLHCKAVCVELKNDLSLTGTLESVDQYLNVKLSNVDVVDKERFPQLLACKDSFIRGSTIRYIQIPRNEVDTELLQDAARKEAQS